MITELAVLALVAASPGSNAWWYDTVPGLLLSLEWRWALAHVLLLSTASHVEPTRLVFASHMAAASLKFLGHPTHRLLLSCVCRFLLLLSALRPSPPSSLLTGLATGQASVTGTLGHRWLLAVPLFPSLQATRLAACHTW